MKKILYSFVILSLIFTSCNSIEYATDVVDPADPNNTTNPTGSFDDGIIEYLITDASANEVSIKKYNNVFVNNFFVTGLQELTSYDFYVQSICSSNNSSWIGPFSSSTSNINNNLDSQNISVYPNPNNKIFNIKSTVKIIKIDVLDILGSKLKTIRPNNNLVEINISENPSGVYFLKISLENENIVTKKIICN